MVNFEMECAGIYALASALRHRALTCCAVLANRVNEQFTDDPEKHVNRLIDAVLERL
jgi:uridine phosphorylase